MAVRVAPFVQNRSCGAIFYKWDFYSVKSHKNFEKTGHIVILKLKSTCGLFFRGNSVEAEKVRKRRGAGRREGVRNCGKARGFLRACGRGENLFEGRRSGADSEGLACRQCESGCTSGF